MARVLGLSVLEDGDLAADLCFSSASPQEASAHISVISLSHESELIPLGPDPYLKRKINITFIFLSREV